MPNPVPGVDYSDIYALIDKRRSTTTPLRDEKRYQENMDIIERYAQREEQDTSLQQQTTKKKQPAWKKILTSKPVQVAGKVLQYTSGSELATKIPVIGEDIERGLNYVPGVRTALAVATNPLTYLTAGGGGAAVTAGRAALTAAGAGLGQAAFEDARGEGNLPGLGLDIPLVPEKYEGAVGAVAGGLAAPAAGARAGLVPKTSTVHAEEMARRLSIGDDIRPGDRFFTRDIDPSTKTFREGVIPKLYPRKVLAAAEDEPNWTALELGDEVDAFKQSYIFDKGSYTRNPQAPSTAPSFGGSPIETAPDALSVLASTPEPQPSALQQAIGRVDRFVENEAMQIPFTDKVIPGWKPLYRGAKRIDQAVANTIAQAAPEILQPYVRAVARPSVAGAAYALTHPEETKNAILKIDEIDHEISLQVAQALLPKTDIDLGFMDVNIEGAGVELLRPTNFINFTPVGAVTKIGPTGVRVAKPFLERAPQLIVREGLGNAAYSAVIAYAQGADSDGIMNAAAIGFAAGAALPVGMDVAQQLIKAPFRAAFAQRTPEQTTGAILRVSAAADEIETADTFGLPEGIAEIPTTASREPKLPPYIKGAETFGRRVWHPDVWMPNQVKSLADNAIANLPEELSFRTDPRTGVIHYAERAAEKGLPQRITKQLVSKGKVFEIKTDNGRLHNYGIRIPFDNQRDLSLFINKTGEVETGYFNNKNDIQRLAASEGVYVRRPRSASADEIDFDEVDLEARTDEGIQKEMQIDGQPIAEAIVVRAPNEIAKEIDEIEEQIRVLDETNNAEAMFELDRRKGALFVEHYTAVNKQIGLPPRITEGAETLDTLSREALERLYRKAVDTREAFYEANDFRSGNVANRTINQLHGYIENRGFEFIRTNDGYRIVDEEGKIALAAERHAEEAAGLAETIKEIVDNPRTLHNYPLNTLAGDILDHRGEQVLEEALADNRFAAIYNREYTGNHSGLDYHPSEFSQDMVYPDWDASKLPPIVDRYPRVLGQGAPASERTDFNGDVLASRLIDARVQSGIDIIEAGDNIQNLELRRVEVAAAHLMEIRGVPVVEELLRDGKIAEIVSRFADSIEHTRRARQLRSRIPWLQPEYPSHLVITRINSDAPITERTSATREVFETYQVNRTLDYIDDMVNRASSAEQTEYNLRMYLDSIRSIRGVPAIERALKDGRMVAAINDTYNNLEMTEPDLRRHERFGEFRKWFGPEIPAEANAPIIRLTNRHPESMRVADNGRIFPATEINETIDKIENLGARSVIDILAAPNLKLKLDEMRGIEVVERAIAQHPEIQTYFNEIDYSDPRIPRASDDMQVRNTLNLLNIVDADYVDMRYVSDRVHHLLDGSNLRLLEAARKHDFFNKYRDWRWKQITSLEDYSAEMEHRPQIENTLLRTVVHDIMKARSWHHPAYYTPRELIQRVELLKDHPLIKRELEKGESWERIIHGQGWGETSPVMDVADVDTVREATQIVPLRDATELILVRQELLDKSAEKLDNTDWEFVPTEEFETLFVRAYANPDLREHLTERSFFRELDDVYTDNLQREEIDGTAEEIAKEMSDLIDTGYNRVDWDEVENLAERLEERPFGRDVSLRYSNHPKIIEAEYEGGNLLEEWKAFEEDARIENDDRSRYEDDDEDYDDEGPSYYGRIDPAGYNVISRTGDNITISVEHYLINIDGSGTIILTNGKHPGASMNGRSTAGDPATNHKSYLIALKAIKDIAEANPDVEFNNSPADDHRAKMWHRLFGFEARDGTYGGAHVYQRLNKEKLNKLYEMKTKKKAAAGASFILDDEDLQLAEDFASLFSDTPSASGTINPETGDLTIEAPELVQHGILVNAEMVSKAREFSRDVLIDEINTPHILDENASNHSIIGIIEDTQNKSIARLENGAPVVVEPASIIKLTGVVTQGSGIWSKITRAANTFGTEFLGLAHKVQQSGYVNPWYNTMEEVIDRLGTRHADLLGDIIPPRLKAVLIHPAQQGRYIAGRGDSSRKPVPGHIVMNPLGVLETVNSVYNQANSPRVDANGNPILRETKWDIYRGMERRDVFARLNAILANHEFTHEWAFHGINDNDFDDILEHLLTHPDFKTDMESFRQLYDSLSDDVLQEWRDHAAEFNHHSRRYNKEILASSKRDVSEFDNGAGYRDEEYGAESGRDTVVPETPDEIRPERGSDIYGDAERVAGLGSDVTDVGTVAPEGYRVVRRGGAGRGAAPTEPNGRVVKAVGQATKADYPESFFRVISEATPENTPRHFTVKQKLGTHWLAPSTKEQLVPRLSEMKTAIEDMFKPSRLRTFSEAWSGHSLGRFFSKTIGGTAATATENYQKAVVGYKRLLTEGESRKGWLLYVLRQEKPPFAEDQNGLWHVENERGVMESVFPGDLMENPRAYKLNAQQEAYVALNHKIIDDLVGEYLDSGGDPKILKDWGIEWDGQHYFPRIVKSKEGFLLEGVYDKEGKLIEEKTTGQTKRQVGAKQTFEKNRRHFTMSDGQAHGVEYGTSIEAMEHFIDAMNYRVSAIKTIEYIKSTGLAKTGKELADFDDMEALNRLEEAQSAVRRLEQGVKRGDNTTQELEAARKVAQDEKTSYDNRTKTGPTAARTGAAISIREARAEQRKIKSLVNAAEEEVQSAGAGRNRPRSIVEVNHAADQDATVKEAKKAFDEAYRKKAGTIIGEVQTPDDARLETAFRNALAKYERLASKNFAEGNRTSRKLNDAILERQRIQDELDELLLQRDALNAMPTGEARKTIGRQAVAKDTLSKKIRSTRTLLESTENRVTRLEKAAAENQPPVIPRDQLQRIHDELVQKRKDAYTELLAAQKALRSETLGSLKADWQTKRALARTEVRDAFTDKRLIAVEEAKQRLSELQTQLAQAIDTVNAARQRGQATNRKSAAIVKRHQEAITEPAYKFGLEGDIIPVKRVSGIPGLQGAIFPAYVADELTQAFNERGVGHTYEWFKKGNDAARLFSASADFGFMFLQGLPVLATNPAAWAKAMYRALQAFFTPEKFAKWVAQNGDEVREISPYVSIFNGSDFFAAISRGSVVDTLARSKATGPRGVAQRGAGKSLQRFGLSFDAFLDASKLYLWQGMTNGKKLTTAEKEAYGRLLRNLTGTTDTHRLGLSKTQREIESMLMFSPRFTRSVFALAAQAMEGGTAGWRARASIATMIGGAAVLFAGIKTALYEKGVTDEPFTWQDLDPSQGGRFMSIRIGDNYYGLGGSMRGAIQLLGGAMMHPETLKSTDSGTNPFLRYARGRLSPAASNTVNLATGETVIGEDVSDRTQWLMTLPDAYIPFGLRAVVESEGGIDQRMAAFGAQAVGGRSYPESRGEKVNDKVLEIMRSRETIRGFNAKDKKEIKRWVDMTTQQKVSLLEAHPELYKELNERDAANWTAYKQAALDATEAKRELGRRWALTQAQNGGQKLSPEDLTSEEYRDQLRLINIRLDAARNALRGSDIVTGEGGDAFEPNVNTHRQAVMRAYYAAIPEAEYKDAAGLINWDKREQLEANFLGTLSAEDAQIVMEETAGASSDIVEQKYKIAKTLLNEYFSIPDVVAAEMGYTPLTIDNSGNERLQKKYRDEVTRRKEELRNERPEIDQQLLLWGYVSVGINEREKGRKKGAFGSLTKGSIGGKLVRRGLT